MNKKAEEFQAEIRQFVPINSFSMNVQTQVMDLAQIITFDSNEYVFTEGDRDKYIYYLLAGELSLISSTNTKSIVMVAGTKKAQSPISRLQPRKFSVIAKTAATILRFASDDMAKLMSSDIVDTTINIVYDSGGGGKSDAVMGDDSDRDGDESSDWMTKILQAVWFKNLPTENMQKLFGLLEPIEFQAGDVVVKQGVIGQYYYIIRDGKCQVVRVASKGKKPIKLGDMSVGRHFGDESLITGRPENATVKMLTAGTLMRLKKEDFLELVKKPSLQGVSFVQALQIIEAGGQWIDVRLSDEYNESNIKSSINIPLATIQIKINKMNPDKHYVICCDTGQRSAAAAFLILQHGFQVSYLEGGIDICPAVQEHMNVAASSTLNMEQPVSTKAPAEAQAEDKEITAEAQAEDKEITAEAQTEDKEITAEPQTLKIDKAYLEIEKQLLSIETAKVLQSIERMRSRLNAKKTTELHSMVAQALQDIRRACNKLETHIAASNQIDGHSKKKASLKHKKHKN